MRTTTSKLTRKYQATIPEPVRTLLNLEAGDTIAFDLDPELVHPTMRRPLVALLRETARQGAIAPVGESL